MLQREILFRGKSTGDLAPWIYGYYHYDKQLNEHYICSTETLFRYDVIPETVGQLVGIKDKDNTPIYEGDIIRVEDKIMEVIFDNGCFYTPHLTSRYRLGGWTADKVQVVGNIHEKVDF